MEWTLDEVNNAVLRQLFLDLLLEIDRTATDSPDRLLMQHDHAERWAEVLNFDGVDDGEAVVVRHDDKLASLLWIFPAPDKRAPEYFERSDLAVFIEDVRDAAASDRGS